MKNRRSLAVIGAACAGAAVWGLAAGLAPEERRGNPTYAELIIDREQGHARIHTSTNNLRLARTGGSGGSLDAQGLNVAAMQGWRCLSVIEHKSNEREARYLLVRP